MPSFHHSNLVVLVLSLLLDEQANRLQRLVLGLQVICILKTMELQVGAERSVAVS